MNVHLRAVFLAAALLSIVACSGNGGGGGDDRPSLAGTWQYVSGPPLLEQDSSFAGGGGPANARIEYLELAADGSGVAHAGASGGQIGCGNLLFGVIDENLVRIDVPDAVIHRTFRYTLDQESLTLVDENGGATVFAAADAVPAASQCSTPLASSSTPLAGDPSGNTSLVSDGTNLYYYTNAGVVSLTIATLATNATITTLGSYPIPVTMQGADFWGRCNCGDNMTQRRTTAGTLVDSIDTATDLSHPIGIGAGAFDGTDLWLTGYNSASNGFELLRVDSAAEPDLLEAVVPLGFYSRGLSYDGTSFWTTTSFLGPMLVTIDPLTGAMTRAVELPAHHYFIGVVVIGQDAYVLGYDTANYLPVLVHVSLPN